MHKEEDLEFLNELDPSELYDYIVERGDNTVESKEDLEALCQPDNRVYGCQSLVWVRRDKDEWQWESNAYFVQGLINIVMSHVVNMADDDIAKLELSKFEFICGEKVTWGRVRGIESFLQKIKTIVTEK
jgi:sulfur transfer protein SufE|tara:strand:+ start:3706 stop:4092 length:387 start_codon:yes stop_codon:yes gene_type:complete